MTTRTTLGAAMSSGRDNNLNLVRALAAIAVIWAHAWGSRGAEEPFFTHFRFGAGDLGVNVFFFLSGLMVTKSFCGRGLGEFAFARIKRIYPALWVSTLLLLLVVGLALSPLGAWEFWRLPSTAEYLLLNSTVLPGVGAQAYLPLAFDAVETRFNVPLWTLPHELSMYGLLALVGIAGGLRRAWVPLVILICGVLSIGAAKFFGLDLMGIDRSRFIAFFFAGAFCYLIRDRITLDGRVALALTALALLVPLLIDQREARQSAAQFAMPYVALWLSFVPAGWIRAYNRIGDYSYGLYIYGFPIQLALQVKGVTDPAVNFSTTLALAGACAVLSWHLIERRALRMPLPRIPFAKWRVQ